MTDAFNSMNVCIFISEIMQSGHWPPFSLYDVEIIYLCRYLFFPLLIWSLSMFWCSIKTVCYRSLAVIYFRRSKSNVRHFDFWSSYLVCMHLNNKILGYFYLHIFPKLFLTHFGRQCIFRKPTCKAIGYVTFVPYPENSFYFLSPNKIYWNG